jgi:hypothetical protein
MEKQHGERGGGYTHELTQDEPYYESSPAQDRPPDGTFTRGTKVVLVSEHGSYTRVRSENDITAYVASGSLRPI